MAGESITLAAGQQVGDGTAVATSGTWFGVTLGSPSQIIKIGDLNHLASSLSSGSFTNDGFHATGQLAPNLTYASSTGLLYAVFTSYNLGANYLFNITSVDPANIATKVDWAAIDTGVTDDQGGLAITTDGTYLYCVSRAVSTNAIIYRILISTKLLVNSLQISGASHQRAHTITYDSVTNRLYFGGTGITPKTAFVGWAEADLSGSATLDVSVSAASISDELTIVGSSFFVNFENESPPTGTVLKVAKDLSSTTTYSIGIQSAVDGQWYDGTSLWVSSPASPSTIVALNPSTGAIVQTIPLTQNTVNEITRYDVSEKSVITISLENPSTVVRTPLAQGRIAWIGG